MKVLIAGGSGFVGQEILKVFLKKGHQVTYLSRHPGDGEIFKSNKVTYIQGDLLKQEDILLKNDSYDLLINCIGAIKPSKLDVLNRVALKACISLCHSYSIPKIVYLSANTGYPLYLKSKRQAEELIKTSGLNYLIIRPGLLYGEHKSTSLIQAKCLQLLGHLPFSHHLIGAIYPLDVSKVATIIYETLISFPKKKILTLEDLKDNKLYRD